MRQCGQGRRETSYGDLGGSLHLSDHRFLHLHNGLQRNRICQGPSELATHFLLYFFLHTWFILYSL